MNKEARRPHLAVDCRMINYSGIGTYIKNILPGIINSHAFTVTVLGVKEELLKFPWFENVRFIKLVSKPLSLFEQVELPLKIPACDIYWSPNINGSVTPTRARRRITTIHDVNHLANAAQHSALKINFIKVLINSSVLHSSFIITVSEFSKAEIIKFTVCKPGKIEVCSLAVAENFNTGFEFSYIFEKYLLFVGNVKPGKNLENALEAFGQITDKAVRFFIVGKKEGFITGYNKTNNLLSDLGDRVVFTGIVSDEELKNYYANAKAFIFPSKYEGFGLPVLEAMKFDLPVIASCAASIPEVGGDAILYFNPDDVDEIRKRMEIVLNDEFIIDKEKYALHLQQFSWNKTIKKHLRLLKNCLA